MSFCVRSIRIFSKFSGDPYYEPLLWFMILGQRWYIWGLNSSGDFCYVKPNTVEFYLKHMSGKTEYQLLSDGTLSKNIFGAGCCLVFSFVRDDGTLHQWNTVLEQCK